MTLRVLKLYQKTIAQIILNVLINISLGQGTARSDAIVIVYMQLAKDAKRVYATAVSARTNNEGFRLEGAIYPTNNQQIELFKEVLEISQVNGDDIDYVESSACGDQVNAIHPLHQYLII